MSTHFLVRGCAEALLLSYEWVQWRDQHNAKLTIQSYSPNCFRPLALYCTQIPGRRLRILYTAYSWKTVRRSRAVMLKQLTFACMRKWSYLSISDAYMKVTDFIPYVDEQRTTYGIEPTHLVCPYELAQCCPSDGAPWISLAVHCRDWRSSRWPRWPHSTLLVRKKSVRRHVVERHCC